METDLLHGVGGQTERMSTINIVRLEEMLQGVGME